MKVNSFNKNSISFNGFYNSKALKGVLKFAEGNGALFVSTTSLVLSSTLRPAVIMATPKTDKDNKKITCVKALSSTLLEFLITLAISMPIVKSVKRINKNPQRYLKEKTIENLKDGHKALNESGAYNLATQLFKLGICMAIAAPKAVINVMIMPFINKILFPNTDFNKSKTIEGENISFKGKKSPIDSIISGIINNKFVQDFSKKYKDSKFPLHMNIAKDVITAGTFMAETAKSNKFDSDKKGMLIYNSLVAIMLSTITGYSADSLTKNAEEKFMSKLKEANKNDPNLKKYIEGAKIAKPVLILGLAYCTFIPLLSTYLGEKFNNKYPMKKK